MKSVRTEQQLLQEALDVQNACNLSGVVHSFSRAMTDLWALCPADQGTEWVNTHPVAVLYSDKIRQLSTKENDSLNQAFMVAMTAQYDMEVSA